jgi:hypothetical protein
MYQIILTFFMLNLLGVFVLRIFLAFDTEIRDMSWMESFYWAVQTTTTIGYGMCAMIISGLYIDVVIEF